MNFKKGFTLVEILVVISIISFLSSIVAVSMTSSRAKAQDVARRVTVGEFNKAIILYKDSNGGFAPGHNSSMTAPVVSGTAEFNSILGALVSGGFIPSLPTDSGIFYFNAGNLGGGDDFTFTGTTLATIPPSTTGIGGSCRPTTSGNQSQATIEGPSYQSYTCTLDTGNRPWKPQNVGGMECRACGPFFCFDVPGTFYTQCSNNEDDEGPGWGEGDGLVDYPADSGCASKDDNGESPDAPIPYCSGVTANSDYCICN